MLALLLWRKRVLRLEQTRQVHGQELWEFSAPRNGQRFSVCRPDLDEDEIERLSQQLEALLGGAAELAAASLGAGTHA